MELYVFKTNVQSEEKAHYLSSLLAKRKSIGRWFIDLEDVDNVLKIEAEKELSQTDILDFVKANGFQCEELD